MKQIAVRFWFGFVIWVLASVIVSGQDMEVETKYKTADTNNAVIEGRVDLPSGFSAERNVRITLRNSQMVLSTRYSNKHGEFRFDNLGEGVYYVRAEVGAGEFEPVEQKVSLGRGIQWIITLQLREKKLPLGFNASRVVSVAELRQVVPSAARNIFRRCRPERAPDRREGRSQSFS